MTRSAYTARGDFTRLARDALALSSSLRGSRGESRDTRLLLVRCRARFGCVEMARRALRPLPAFEEHRQLFDARAWAPSPTSPRSLRTPRNRAICEQGLVVAMRPAATLSG